MSKNCVVFGAGPHARVIIDILRDDSSLNVVGIIDSKLNIGQEFYGLPIIGRQDDLKNLSEANKFLSGIVAIGDNFLREKVVKEIVSQIPNFEFVNAIAKSSQVSQSVKIGHGNVFMHGAIVNSESQIKNHCIVNTNSTVEHNCRLEDFSSISPGVTLGGFVEINSYSAIAIGCTVFDRLTVGSNVVVGGGSLVVNDLESNYLYYGSPAKKIRRRKTGEKFLK